ncbi:hypothetical protein ABPG72_014124 [Tetrahymena utriculariae]
MQDLNNQDQTPTDFFSIGIKELTKQLDQCVDLNTLKIDLSAVQLDDSGLISISRTITKFYKTIQILILEIERNGIGNEGMNYLCETLKTCGNINFLKLNLRINKINDDSFRNLANTLIQNKNLSYIIFDFRQSSLPDKVF